MRNHKFSQGSRDDIKKNKTNQRLEEKAVLVSAAGKCLPQSSSDRCYIANEPLEEDPEEEPSEVEEDPEEEPSEVEEDPEELPSEIEEDPEEESVEEIGNKLEKEPSDGLEDDPEEDPIEELEEEPSKVLLEQIEEPSECDAQSCFNHSNNRSEEPVENALEASPAECHSGTDPNNSYKKRSLDASTGESVALQGYQSQKKCRQEESLKPESESSYAAPHFHSQSGLAMTLGDKCSSEQQEGTGSSRKRRHSRWEKVENAQTSKRKKTRWISDDLQLKLLGPLQLPDLGKEFVVGSDLDSEIQELQAELADINKKLQTSEFHDDKPMEERSPSPEPVHDNLGNRLNPRQVRPHQKLVQKLALQGYQSQKKCRQEESLKPESESSYAAPHFHSQSGLAMTLGDKCSSEQQEGTGSSRKRRHSRWEKVENAQTSKRKKTRWISDDLQLKLLGPLQLPDLGKEFVVGSDLDSEIQELQAELADKNRKLQTSEFHDGKPMEERSPSPEPVHDNLGNRLNPWQVRPHQKLVQKRQHIISKLIKKNSTFKPPSEYKSSKLCKKIYIPVKEYPNYNFVGLIIGPLGKTQKRMEKETGAKIRLRGKDKTTNPQKNDEDLHVYIEADNQKSLDAAVGMVEKLLNPIDDAMNEHKRVQLEELATLKASMCRICHEHGHHYFACPQRQSTFKMVCCDKCGSYKHPTETCGVIAMSPQSKSGQGSGSNLGSTTKTQDRPNKEIDNTNLYVNHLPENVDDNRLLEFFSPFGKITKARVVRNQTTGISKGYGFVKFENQIDAAAAMAHLNGCRMDGHMLAVRIAGVPPGSLFLSHLSAYQGPPPIFPNVTSQIAWPGWIPGSILPVPLTPFPISNGMNLHSSSIFVEHGNVLKSEGLGFTPASGLSSLSDLPGCSSLHSSSNSSNQIQSSSGGLITQFPGDPDFPSSGFESYF